MSETIAKNAAAELLDALGRERVRLALFDISENPDAGRKSLSQAIWKGILPASWYGKISQLCEAEGMDCPHDLFSFKTSEKVA